jgi:hypothetical protein
MQSTYPTQHCGCDFCSSRRAVNAKKLSVSQMAAQKRGDCTCQCHSKDKQRIRYGASAGFDPDYPEPVNQTALNASRSRNGVPGGNQYTIKNRSTRAGELSGSQAFGNGNGSGNEGEETAEQRQARETAELDALERLLIAEHRARVRATMERERLKSASTNAATRRPQPLPEGYAADGTHGSNDNGGSGASGSWGNGGLADSYGQNARTIHEAYAMAQECPITPPAQCHASHRLQDTMNDVRKVTGDPVNPSNRRSLQRLLNKNGMGSGEDGDSEMSSVRGDAASAAGVSCGTVNAFGSSLAQIRTSNSHPRGAGVVWMSAAPQQSSTKNTHVLMVESGVGGPAAASGSAKYSPPPPLSPGATATGAAAQQSSNERHVTYAA